MLNFICVILLNSDRICYKFLWVPTLGKQKTDHIALGNFFCCKMREKNSKVLVN